jgi:hypothetical protein
MNNNLPSIVFTLLRQVLKSRIQSAPSGTYSGLFDCFRKTVARDGITALWKGLGPAMARVCHFHDCVGQCLLYYYFRLSQLMLPHSYVLFLNLILLLCSNLYWL